MDSPRPLRGLSIFESPDELRTNASSPRSPLVKNGFSPCPPGRPVEANMSKFLHEVSALLEKYITTQPDASHPVTRHRSPEELEASFNKIGVALSLDDSSGPQDLDKILSACELTLDLSVRTGHPLFFNQLYARADTVGIAAEWLSVATHTAVHTYEVSPVFTMMEREVLKKMAAIIGGRYREVCDGLLVPGGSISNLYSMHIARFKADPDFRTRGMYGGPRLVAFVSSHAHYSFEKAAMVIGLGTDNLVKVKANARGQMEAAALTEAIEKAKLEGRVPFFVGSTAGTTVLGSYDDINSIADVCAKYGIWFHIDAAWGGSAIFSERTKHLLKGLDRADSFAWNPHKVMGAPMQCSIVVTCHENILASCNASGASYLFQPDKGFAQYDIGDKTIQCGRRADVFKLWCMWKAYGDSKIAEQIDLSFGLAEYFERRVLELEKVDGSFVLAFPRNSINVCFWYIPPSMRPFNRERATEDDWKKLGRVAPMLKEKLLLSGEAMVGFQPLENYPNFFRIVFASPWRVNQLHLDRVLAKMAAVGKDLSFE